MFRQTAILAFAFLALLPPSVIDAFTTTTTHPTRASRSAVVTKLAPNDNDFMKWAKQSRSAGPDDVVVELNRPLGLILNQDSNSNVYVEKVAPRGNAARTGKVGGSFSLLRFSF